MPTAGNPTQGATEGQKGQTQERYRNHNAPKRQRQAAGKVNGCDNTKDSGRDKKCATDYKQHCLFHTPILPPRIINSNTDIVR